MEELDFFSYCNNSYDISGGHENDEVRSGLKTFQDGFLSNGVGARSQEE